jgi:hypothetical protein
VCQNNKNRPQIGEQYEYRQVAEQFRALARRVQSRALKRRLYDLGISLDRTADGLVSQRARRGRPHRSSVQSTKLKEHPCTQ